MVDLPAKPAPQKRGFAEISAAVDTLISKRYPQINKLILFPNRNSQLELYENVWELLAKKNQNYRSKRFKENAELPAKRQFDRKVQEFNKENFKKQLIINNQFDHKLPADIYQAMIALEIYDNHPVINGRIAMNLNDDKSYRNGDLKYMTPAYFSRLIKEHHGSLMVDGKSTNLKNIPEFSLIKAFLRNPNDMTKVRAKIKKQEENYRDPKKFARMLVKNKNLNFLNAANRSNPNKYMDYRDRKNFELLDQNLKPENTEDEPDKGDRVGAFLRKTINNKWIKDPYRLYKKFEKPELSYYIKRTHELNQP